MFHTNIKNVKEPWLVWLSGLSAGLWTKESPVRFPVRAHAWVQARSSGGDAWEATTWKKPNQNKTKTMVKNSKTFCEPLSDDPGLRRPYSLRNPCQVRAQQRAVSGCPCGEAEPWSIGTQRGRKCSATLCLFPGFHGLFPKSIPSTTTTLPLGKIRISNFSFWPVSNNFFIFWSPFVILAPVKCGSKNRCVWPV